MTTSTEEMLVENYRRRVEKLEEELLQLKTELKVDSILAGNLKLAELKVDSILVGDKLVIKVVNGEGCIYPKDAKCDEDVRQLYSTLPLIFSGRVKM